MTINFALSSYNVTNIDLKTSDVIILPAFLRTSNSPGFAWKIFSIGTRESMHPKTTACKEPFIDDDPSFFLIHFTIL